VSTRSAQQPAPAGPPPAAGDLVRFVEPAGRRRARVGTVERRIARGRHEGALVVRVGAEPRRYVLPPDRLRRMGPAAPPPEAPPAPEAPPRPAPAPPAPPAVAVPAPVPGEPLRLFD